MHSSLLSLPVNVAAKLDHYAVESSTGVSQALKKHWLWTRDTFPDADRSSSLLQAQWMARLAEEKNAKRVLDVGCYTGLSAMAWYEGTTKTKAEILTIEYDAELAATARKVFQANGCDDRIKVVEGNAETILANLEGQFDIVFVDLEFSAYRVVVEQILGGKLLSETGVILVDNVFARGFAVDNQNMANVDTNQLERWVVAGQQVREFNEFLSLDARVDVTVFPFFDGISEVRWKKFGN